MRLDPSPAPEVLVAVEQAARDRLPETIPGLSTRAELRTSGLDIDEMGRAHVRFQQAVDGVPVFGADLVLHLDEQGDLLGVTDALLREVRVDTTPTIDEAVAVATARATIAPRVLRPESIKTRLVVQGEDTLAWEVRMELLDEPEAAAIPIVFVDAHSGSILWSYDNLMKSWLDPVSSNGAGTTLYDGDQQFNAYLESGKYYHEDIVRGIATLDFGTTTTTMTWKPSDEAIFSDQEMNQAHWSAGRYLDFIRDRFGRTGIASTGYTTSHAPGIPKLLTLGTSYGVGVNNAGWNGLYAFFGEGDGSVWGWWATLDVVAHELTHALIQSTSNLLYNGESGGLNESMADVFGAGLEAYQGYTGNAVWGHSDDCAIGGGGASAARWFDDPALNGRSLDFYSGLASLSDVHDSSGIGNLAFYLAAVGGSHPRRTTTPITGIGMNEALQIWHMAMSFYMPSMSTYHDGRKGTLDAATYLYGANSAQLRAVADAWTAVGVYPCATTWQKSNRAWKKGETVYYPSSSGFTVADGQTLVGSLVDVTTASAANLDLYLEVKPATPKGRFAQVAASEQAVTAEHISYTAPPTGPLQARWVVKAKKAAASNMELCADAR